MRIRIVKMLLWEKVIRIKVKEIGRKYGKWQSTPVFLPGESQGWGGLVGCCLWGCMESNTIEAT